MIRNFFLITFRSMLKNKAFIIINVIGMGVAIGICIVAYLAWQYDAGFDGIHQQGEKIYRVTSVREFENKLTYYGHAPLPLAEIVDKTFPDVSRSTKYLRSASNFKRGDDLFPGNLSYVDPDFFQLFSFEIICGNAADLGDKTSLFISESMAARLFRDPQEALGKTITKVYGNQLTEVKIAGVFAEPPANSSFYNSQGSAYMNAENYKDENKGLREDDWQKEATLFIEIADANNVKRIHQKLQAYTENNNVARLDFHIKEFKLDQFSSMAHLDRSRGIYTSTWGSPPVAAIIGSIIMSVLILLIACFNLTNTAIAISARRLKEIGIRKVMGSMRIQLIVQFIGETTFICFMALLVALSVADPMIEGWNHLTMDNIHLTPTYLDSPRFLLFATGVLLFTGVVAGSYPAFYISKFKPVSILKGKLKFGGTNYFTRTLLGLQFAISLIAIVSAIGFLQNARFQERHDLGFDIRGSVIAWIDNESEFNTYRNALQTNPDIVSVAGAASGIFSNRDHEPVKHESKQVEVDIIAVGDNYLNTMNLELLEGRDFRKDSETDQRESVIITRKMADMFDWDQPLGKEILWKDSVKLFVIGVIKDVYTTGFWRELEPMMIRYVLPEQYNQIVASAEAGNVSSVNAWMNEQWNHLFPNRLYNGKMLVWEFRQFTELGMNLVYSYTFMGLIALVLSITGLFTLASLNIVRRTKEIGVRKVLGATVFGITRIINTEFVIILAFGSLLGSLYSYMWTNTIMGSIWRYYQAVNVWTFVAAIGILFVVSLLTIGYKVFTLASINPVNTLRDE